MPGFGFMVAGFAVLGTAGIGLDAALLRREARPADARETGRGLLLAAAAAALVLAGIFVMRFAFYMMHMTVGLGV